MLFRSARHDVAAVEQIASVNADTEAIAFRRPDQAAVEQGVGTLIEPRQAEFELLRCTLRNDSVDDG